MKTLIQNLIATALEKIRIEGLVIPPVDQIQIEKTRDELHGNYSSNIALILCKQAGTKPADLAKKIVENIPESEFIVEIEIAGPGFINFFLGKDAYNSLIHEINKSGHEYGRSDFGHGTKILIEFVSANPTGPLHIGHGRGAAYGATLSNLLKAQGYDVDTEYYVNDAGRQMDILTLSIWLRYLELCNQKIVFPDNAYQGNYIKDIAGQLFKEKNTLFNDPPDFEVCTDAPDQDKVLDRLVDNAKNNLGETNFKYIFKAGLDSILDEIRSDLELFGVTFSSWLSENSLMEDSKLDACLESLKSSGLTYSKDNALWFKSTELGDEKDRVVVRENGQSTYFASDIIYHKSKLDRNYDQLIDIWGADHHGYIARVKAAMKALGEDENRLNIVLVQFASLYRGKEKIQMSTRSGQYITLKELIDEVGKDAARFFYILRKSEQHLDFDLELAKSESNDNPVYYIQYAHARICSVFKQLKEKGYEFSLGESGSELKLLKEEHEQKLMSSLSLYQEILHNAAIRYEPHLLAFYLRDLANEFHSYYNSCQFLVEEPELRNARLTLICATRQIIKNGLEILGVSSPEIM